MKFGPLELMVFAPQENALLMLHSCIYAILISFAIIFSSIILKKNKPTGELPPCARDLRKGSPSRCVLLSEAFLGASSSSEGPQHSLDQSTAFQLVTSHQPRGLVWRGRACRWALRLQGPTLASCLPVKMAVPIHGADSLSG